ncbi:hypothetical protein CHS0354_012527 [Potamilus streckersoni]|uniref:lysoplasmalogenase n=1 Tax=Potamilus streckersoni TaxID=2493646 RepID=A0AAE0W3E8_9BIVA|nr:hypothetical protein CHS0354_012527 [Potamilus streckersoni]
MQYSAMPIRLFRNRILPMDGKLHIILFIASINVYFTRYDFLEMAPPDTVLAGYDKIAPLWLLTAYVATVIKTSTPQRDNIAELFYIQLGLLATIFSEIIQMVPHILTYIPSNGFLLITHVSYSIAFGAYRGTRVSNILFFLMCLCGFLSIQVQIKSYTIKAFVMCYSVLLGNSAWRAATRFQDEKTIGTCISWIGAMLFIYSDYVFAYNKWAHPIENCRFLVTLTYYAAHFGIALGETLKFRANKINLEFLIWNRPYFM